MERTPPGFMFNIKAFGLFTYHPVVVERLPAEVKALLPADAAGKTRSYLRNVPKEAGNLIWEMKAQALAILDGLPRVGPFIFPGRRLTEPMSNAAMTMLLRRMGRGEISVHGFRSTFRDWAREQTLFPRDVCEAALAHATADKTERAYLRGDALDLRRQLMGQFATKAMQFF